jgi:hypothetical protein
MRRCRIIAVAGCFLWLTDPAFALGASGVSVWFVDSLTKVFPTDAARTHRLPVREFLGARNQHVSIQLAIRSVAPLASVTAEVTPLEGTKGERLADINVYHVGYVVVGSHTPDTPPEELVGEAPGWYPDPLLDFPLHLERRRTHSLWAIIHIPPDAAPGNYRGAIEVRAAARRLARAAFRLKVVAATVPTTRSLKVTNWFSLDDKASRQFYGVPAFSPQWWTLVENVARVMADHRQNVALTPLMELIQPRLEAVPPRGINYDFSNFDRWVETFQKAGAIGYIEGSHLLSRAGSYDAALQVPTLQVAEGEVRSLALPPDDPHVEPFLTGFLGALNSHLKQRGWQGIYFQHILDEAHGGEPLYYGKFAELVRREMPGIPTLDAVDAEKVPDILQRTCDIWVPQLGRFDNQTELVGRRIQSGHEVWFYTCLFPRRRYLNRLMDYPLLKVRLLHWLNFRYNLTGFLHWGGNYWTPEPMKDTQPVIDNNTELLPAGDAFILYPDRAHLSVRSSIRLEAMREGIEDYELLRALQSKNPAQSERVARSAISSFTEYVRDPAEFRRIERSLLQAAGQD